MKAGKMVKEKLKVVAPEEIDNDDPVVAQLKVISAKLSEQIAIQRQTDWKMWVVMNGLIDSLIENGALKNDPRKE
jgi:hypothetical protein